MTESQATEPERCCANLKLRFPVQCSRLASVYRDGRPYCGTHDPERIRPAVTKMPQWVRVRVDGENVVLSFGSVEKPMIAAQAKRLGERLLEAARTADEARIKRLIEQYG